MPQYLSTTQPESLLLLRRLDGYGSPDQNGHPLLRQQPNGRLAGDQRGRWRHRAPNNSHQSLRFDEAQRRVKRVEDFKRAQNAFQRVLPLRCWSGRLPFASFYRDDYMPSRATSSWKVAPRSTTNGTTEEEQTALSTRSNSISSLLPLQANSERTPPLDGHSSYAPHLQPIPRSSIGRRRLDGSSSLTPVAVATDDDDDVIFECEVCGRSLFEPSAAPRDRLKGK